MPRPLNKHLDNKELNAMVPSCCETGQDQHVLDTNALSDAKHHVSFCLQCSSKVWRYQQLINRFSIAGSKSAPPGSSCPKDDEVDWFEVAVELWPESKSAQLIMHAALCEHCGPLLRAAARLNSEPTPEEEQLLAQLQLPLRPDAATFAEWSFTGWLSMHGLIPALALIVIAIALSMTLSSSRTPVSGPEFAHLAVDVHRQHAQGSLALDLRSDSQQALNEWLKTKSEFSVTLPASPLVPGEKRPYQLEGARLVKLAGHSAAFVAYQAQLTEIEETSGPRPAVSLMIIPVSVVAASGGTEVALNQLRFHYALVQEYKVVTWSQHGLTYALVSQDGYNSQRSCMVCHSAMRDRDLSRTPSPLHINRNPMEPLLQ